MNAPYSIGVDPAAGGSLTVAAIVGEDGVFDSFIIPYEWDLTGRIIQKGREDDITDDSGDEPSAG